LPYKPDLIAVQDSITASHERQPIAALAELRDCRDASNLCDD
jgi:hypothetical protein